MHYADEAETRRSVLELDQLLHRLLSVILCRLLGWNSQKELKVGYASPCSGQLPDYVALEREKLRLSTQGAGKLEAEDGSCTVECNGTVEWNPDSILGQMASTGQDAIKIHELMKD